MKVFMISKKVKKNRSLKKPNFAQLKKNGLSQRKKGFFVVYRKNKLPYARFSFVFPRYSGNAVQRNRFKRWARALLNRKQELLGLDLLLGFEKKEKDRYKKMKYKEFCEGFSALLPENLKDL